MTSRNQYKIGSSDTPCKTTIMSQKGILYFGDNKDENDPEVKKKSTLREFEIIIQVIQKLEKLHAQLFFLKGFKLKIKDSEFNGFGIILCRENSTI